MFTVENVLHSHGIKGTGDTLTDNARADGIIRACLQCGSVVGIPAGLPESHRVATRDSIAWEDAPCCEDGDEVMF